jgi:hypothetical protein
MNMKYAFAMLAAAGALSGPVRAGEPSVEPDMERFRSMIKPADIDLFFNYFREAMKAGMDGRLPPQPPAQLSSRARELAESFRKEGSATMDQMLQQFQEEMKKALPPDLPPETTPEAPQEKPAPQPDYRT